MQGVRPTGSVLELGGGSGAMAEGTARAFPDLTLTVTDIDPAMVSAARRRLSSFKNVTVIAADVTSLPFESASFDMVASYLMLHHVIVWRQALSEAARVMRPGGIFVGYDLDRTWLAEAVHVVDRSPHHLIGHDDLLAGLIETGFEDVELTRAFGGHIVRFLARKTGDKGSATRADEER